MEKIQNKKIFINLLKIKIMKKVFRFFTIAAIACGMTMAVSCNDDNDDNGGGNGGGNNDNLPTTLDVAFTDGVIPSDWTNIDADGDGYVWCNYVIHGETGEQIPQECILSASYENGVGALTPDNYLVSPKIRIEEGAVLSYTVGAIDHNYYREHYTVYLGTVENGVFTPSSTLLSETLTTADDKQKTIDLTPYKGQAVQIAFRHHDVTDQYVMTLKNVKVAQ